jgi:hypothetical protein
MTEPTPEEIRERLDALRASARTEDDGPVEDGASSEGDEAVQEFDLQVIQLTLSSVNIGVGQAQDGSKVLVIGPFALQLHIPLNQNIAGQIGATLTGGVHVPGVELDLGRLGLDRQAIEDAARVALEREGRRSARRR